MKKIYITNGTARSGKDSFAELLSKYISVFKYSSIDLVKEMYETIGIDRNSKDEKKRKLYSDTKDMLTKYDDIPFKDIASIVSDFKNNQIDAEVLLIDIREPEEIARAVETLGAEAILIRNPNVRKIESNHADKNVENYNYDYIIENNGTLEQLDGVAKSFCENIIKEQSGLPKDAYCIFSEDAKKKTIVFQCNKMLR